MRKSKGFLVHMKKGRFLTLTVAFVLFCRQDVDAASEIRLPEFSYLVNYPDFISRGRGDGKHAANGKRNCVMCGKVRVCSASSLSLRKSSTKHVDDEGGALHIIPRQNKGVCTACDVTVWAVVDNKDGLEIKWCKGCKNFRPWAAFGEKGSATKCVRCRTRQKEKYAAAKSNSSANKSRLTEREKGRGVETKLDS